MLYAGGANNAFSVILFFITVYIPDDAFIVTLTLLLIVKKRKKLLIIVVMMHEWTVCRLKYAWNSRFSVYESNLKQMSLGELCARRRNDETSIIFSIYWTSEVSSKRIHLITDCSWTLSNVFAIYSHIKPVWSLFAPLFHTTIVRNMCEDIAFPSTSAIDHAMQSHE